MCCVLLCGTEWEWRAAHFPRRYDCPIAAPRSLSGRRADCCMHGSGGREFCAWHGGRAGSRPARNIFCSTMACHVDFWILKRRLHRWSSTMAALDALFHQWQVVNRAPNHRARSLCIAWRYVPRSLTRLSFVQLCEGVFMFRNPFAACVLIHWSAGLPPPLAAF